MVKSGVIRPLWLLSLSILIPWVFVFTGVSPARQEFPLNDDWAYSKGAFAFARGDGIHYYRQGSMPLLGQWLLSYPLIRLAGESHAALRFFMVVCSALGVFAFRDLLMGNGLDDGVASFAAAALALNPLYFLLSGTYMSDVSSLAFSLAALACYDRAMRNVRTGWMVAGAVGAVLAIINRQNTIVVPITYLILLCRDRTLRRRTTWILGALLPFVVGLMVNTWFSARSDVISLGPALPSMRRLFTLAFAGTMYLGLSALPVLALRWGARSALFSIVLLVIAVDCAVACIWFDLDSLLPSSPYDYPVAANAGLFPYLHNMITPWGTFENQDLVVGDRPAVIAYTAQVMITALGCVAGAGFAARLIERAGQERHRLANPLLIFTALHLLILFVSPFLFDRYLIVLIPGALALSAGVSYRCRWPIGGIVFALSAVCSVGLMHDWLSWNSARWELGRRAVSHGIAIEEIEGGLEWDSWFAPVPVTERSLGPASRGLMLTFNRLRFPHLTGRYALAFSQTKGTKAIDGQPYHLWLPPHKERFLLLEQSEPDPK